VVALQIHARAGQPPPGHEDGGATAGDRSDHAQYRRMTDLSDDERKQITALGDEFGAVYKIQVAPTKRKGSLLGRPAIFVANGGLMAASGSCLAVRSPTRQPGASGTIVAPAPIAQLVGNQLDVFCTLAPNAKGSADPDVLHFESALMRGLPAATERRLSGHSVTPWLLVAPRAGRRLASCSDDGTIRLWDTASHRELASFPCYKCENDGPPVRGDFVAFSPYGLWLATAYDQRVSFRMPKDGVELLAWRPNVPDQHRIMAIRFDADGNTLLAFTEDAGPTEKPTVKFFQYDIDCRQEYQFKGTHGVADGRATVDGKYIVTWDGSPEVVFWDLETRKEIDAVRVTPGSVYDVSFSPMGDVMATAGDDGEAKLWRISDRARLQTGKPIRHNDIDLVRFLPNGKGIVTGSDDGWLKLWEAPDFCWDRRPIPKTEFGENLSTITERYEDGRVLVVLDDGVVKETLPDGTVKTYKRQ
jgi:hypothetical protein